MKKLCFVLLLLSGLNLVAQNKNTSIQKAPAFNADIEKVARDYYDHFENIKGEKISETENMIEYSSKINPQDILCLGKL